MRPHLLGLLIVLIVLRTRSCQATLEYTPLSLVAGQLRLEGALYEWQHNSLVKATDNSTFSSSHLDLFPLYTRQHSGVATLLCHCPSCPTGDEKFPECYAGDCFYESRVKSGALDRALIPLPPVKNPISMLTDIMHRTFRDSNKEETALRQNTFVAFKISRIYDLDRHEWVNFVPTRLELGKCRIRWTKTHEISSYPIVKERKCDKEEFFEVVRELRAGIEGLDDPEANKTLLEERARHLESFFQREVWKGCEAAIRKKFVVGRASKQWQLSATERCDSSFGTENWLEDPCCNEELAFTQCCVPRISRATRLDVIGMTSKSDNDDDDDELFLLAKRYWRAKETARSCDARARMHGVHWDMVDRLTDFVKICKAKIYGPPGAKGPHCEHDSHCYSMCDQNTKTCQVPYEDVEKVSLQCFRNHIDSIMERAWREEWDLTGESSQTTFDAAFHQHLQHNGCTGPLAGKLERHNKTACLIERGCNWDTTRNVSDCGKGHFCGQCHGRACWAIGEPSMCYSWVESERSCKEMNGIRGPWGDWHCVFPQFNSEQSCVPPNMCGVRPRWQEDHEAALGDRWCPGMCIVNNIHSAAECSRLNQEHKKRDSVPLHPLDASYLLLKREFHNTGLGLRVKPNDKELHTRMDTIAKVMSWYKVPKRDMYIGPTKLNRKTGKCIATSLSARDCMENKKTSWFHPRNFHRGQFQTRKECLAGQCTADIRMNRQQCKTIGSCNKACGRCRPRNHGATVCYATQENEMLCTENSGVWIPNFSVCLYDGKRSPEECGATRIFERCEDNVPAECTVGLTAFAQHHLECHVNPWDKCETQKECEEESGECDDEEFGDEGACVGAFKMTREGLPICNGTRSRAGCIYTHIHNQDECEQSKLGRWKQRATNEASCKAHGAGCIENRGGYVRITHKQPRDCQLCGGTPTALYHWTKGVWEMGQMRKLYWIPQQYGPINSWAPTLDWEGLEKTVRRTATRIVAREIQRHMMCKYEAVAAALSDLVCKYGNATKTTEVCPSFFTVPQGSRVFYAGIGGNATWPKTTLQVPPEAISPSQDSVKISIHAFAHLPKIIFPTLGKPNRYEVVTNRIPYVIGQLIGPGVQIDIAGELKTPITLCIKTDKTIPRDIDGIYPVMDFASYAFETWTPRGMGNIRYLKDEEILCGKILKGGSFYPIVRMADWREMTGTHPPTSATTTTTLALGPADGVWDHQLVARANTTTTVTTTTTAAPTAPPANSLSIGSAIGIAFGSLAGIVIIVVTCLFLRTKLGSAEFAPQGEDLGDYEYDADEELGKRYIAEPQKVIRPQRKGWNRPRFQSPVSSSLPFHGLKRRVE
jgi:hypothetical protein